MSVINELEGSLEADMKRIEKARQSILYKAFSGKLVT